jgi:hypothetical protein
MFTVERIAPTRQEELLRLFPSWVTAMRVAEIQKGTLTTPSSGDMEVLEEYFFRQAPEMFAVDLQPHISLEKFGRVYFQGVGVFLPRDGSKGNASFDAFVIDHSPRMFMRHVEVRPSHYYALLPRVLDLSFGLKLEVYVTVVCVYTKF